MENSIHHSATIYNYLKQLNLCRIFPQRVIKHLMFILIAVFSLGYHGKTVDFNATVLAIALPWHFFSMTENGTPQNSEPS